MEKLKLNYGELAFIMGLEVKLMKDIFIKELDKDKVSIKDEIQVSELKMHFSNIKSLDARYDGAN